MSIIDELVVKLKLDLGRFKSDANAAESTLNNVSDASQRTARNVESHGNMMASGFGKVRNQMLAVLGLFTAGMGIKNFTQSTIKQADAFGFMSDSVGMSTTRLRAYSDAAERAGGSGEAMTDALKKSAADVANLKMGIKTLAEVDQGNLLTRWSGAAGLDPSKIMESGESLLQARLKVFEAIRKTDKDNPLLHGVDPAVLANTVLEQGGIGAGVTNALKNKGGLEGFNKSVSNQEKINSPLAGSEEAARGAREAFFDLNKEVTVFSQNAVISATPAMTKLTKALSKIKLPSAAKVSQTIDKWMAKFESGVNSVDKYAKALHFENAWDMLATTAENTLGRIGKGWTLIGESMPEPETVADFVDEWIPKINEFVDDSLTPAIDKSTEFAGVLIEDWEVGRKAAIDGLVSMAEKTKSWIDYLGDAINKVKELSSATTDWASRNVIEPAAGLVDKAKEALGIGDEKGNEPNGDVKTSVGQRQMMSNVYAGFKKAGLDDKQARVMTAQVGRENDFNEKTIFGYHNDPARGVNLGMISWQGDRGAALEERMKAQGLMKGGKMEHSQAAIDAQTQFAVDEMRGEYRGKLSSFFDKKDASWSEMSKETGKNYVGWAYGQDTIKKGDGTRVPFDWQSQHAREAGYYNKLGDMGLGNPVQGTGNPPPIVIPNGVKDANGRLKGLNVPNATELYSSMPNTQTSPRASNSNSINIGSQTFNIKANDTDGIKKELSNKMIISESLTQNFNSGMQ